MVDAQVRKCGVNERWHSGDTIRRLSLRLYCCPYRRKWVRCTASLEILMVQDQGSFWCGDQLGYVSIDLGIKSDL